MLPTTSNIAHYPPLTSQTSLSKCFISRDDGQHVRIPGFDAFWPLSCSQLCSCLTNDAAGETSFAADYIWAPYTGRTSTKGHAAPNANNLDGAQSALRFDGQDLRQKQEIVAHVHAPAAECDKLKLQLACPSSWNMSSFQPLVSVC